MNNFKWFLEIQTLILAIMNIHFKWSQIVTYDTIEIYHMAYK
jgi:hypothetical protein